jgi:hypothetical protein
MRIIESGKYKGKTLAQCPESYIIWASKHRKNFSPDNRWVSDDSQKLLDRMAQEQKAQEIAASKLSHMESLAQNGSFLAQMDLQMTKFIATNKVAEEIIAAPKYPVNKYGISNVGLAGNLNGSSQGYRLLR